MDDSNVPEVTGAPMARVADSYGDNPHEHKPSQDTFAPDADLELAEAKQAATGGRSVDDDVAAKAAERYADQSDDGSDDVSAGTSSSRSENSNRNSSEKTRSDDSETAQTTGNRTAPGRMGTSSARSTATGPSKAK